MTLDFFERFRENVERLPDRVALQSISEVGREAFSYRRVGEEVRKVSLFLQRSGVGPGDAVGLLMENHPRWGIAFLAAQSAGAIIVPLDILHQPETLARLILHAECRFLIVSQRLLPAWREIQRGLPAPLPTLFAGDPADGCVGWEAVLGEMDSSAPLPLAARGLDQELLIMYTSGTTGDPKGVVLTQRNVIRNVVGVLRLIHVTEDDHMLSVLPLYHVLALMVNFILPLYAGCRVTYLETLEAQHILKTFREEGISLFVCVPQFFYLLHARILQEVGRQEFWKRFAFRRLLAVSRFANRCLGYNPGRRFFAAIHAQFGPRFRLMGVGGARFDPRIAESLRDLGFNLAQAYGLTETAALGTVAPPIASAVGSAGRPLPHAEIRIDEPGQNGVGEVLIRGENVMKGYWKNPEATAEAIREGWFHSGDLGWIDGRKNLHITGRKKDVIVLSSGKNIYPEEIEHFYQSNCPQIKEICIVGIPDPGSGGREEILHAVIVPDFAYLKGRGVTQVYDAIRWTVETVSQRLPSFKRAHSLEIRTEPLPATTTRKFRRFQILEEVLRKRKESLRAQPAAERPPETPTEGRIFDLIRSMKPGTPVARPMNLELDLGFSSLERAELLSNVQQSFGVKIIEEEAAKIHTVHDLVIAVEGGLGGAAIEADQARGSWRARLAEPLEPEDERGISDLLGRRPVVDLAYVLGAQAIRVLFRLLFRGRVEGRENLPAEGPFLICPNHVTYLDAFFIVSTLPRSILRRIVFLGDTGYFSGPVTSRLGRLARVMPINPDRGAMLSMRLAAEGLRRGFVLGIFPEGERSIDGSLKQFRPGAAILSAELRVPVVPAGIRGAWEIWPRGTNRIRLRPVTILFGKPLMPAPEGESYAALTGRLFRAVEELSAGGAGSSVRKGSRR